MAINRLRRGTPPLRLQDANFEVGFPPHIAAILNPGGKLPCKEFLTRLVHICMIEVGFVPVIEGNEDLGIEDLYQAEFLEHVPALIRGLQKIIDKRGNLHSVAYKSIVMEKYVTTGETSGSRVEIISSEAKAAGKSITGENIPVTGKESGDGSGLVADVSSEESMEEDVPSADSREEWRMSYSGMITVGIIYDGGDMLIVATGPGFHKNMQISPFQYVHTRTMILPTVKMEDYLGLFNFSPYHFANDIKRKFCYQIMDEIDGLSFDIRSLSLLPPEVIVEIAKRCSPLQVFRLRATCYPIKEALSRTHVEFWKFLIRREFPLYKLDNLASIPGASKYYEKYCELCKFNFIRPIRRTIAHPRILPLFLLNNFRP